MAREHVDIEDMGSLIKGNCQCCNAKGAGSCSYSCPIDNDTPPCYGVKGNFRAFVFSNIPTSNEDPSNTQVKMAARLIARLLRKPPECVRSIQMTSLLDLPALGENDILIGDPNVFSSEQVSDGVIEAIRKYPKALFLLYTGSADCIINCQLAIDSLSKQKPEDPSLSIRVCIFSKLMRIEDFQSALINYRKYFDCLAPAQTRSLGSNEPKIYPFSSLPLVTTRPLASRCVASLFPLASPPSQVSQLLPVPCSDELPEVVTASQLSLLSSNHFG